MTSLISFILIISFLIFIHELGHLLAAKWANVKVEDFSIGFGPKIFSFNIGETKYSLSLLPLGGYVKMQGEDISEVLDSKDIVEIDPNRSYKNIPNFKKQIILFAGPFMNLLLPFLFLPMVYINGLDVPSFLEKAPVVGHVKEDLGSQYFKKGDKILKINNTNVSTWKDIGEAKPGNSTKTQNILIDRNNSIKNISYVNKGAVNLYILDYVFPLQPAVIGGILPKSIADKAQLNNLDKIVTINDIKVESWYQISEILSTPNVSEFQITIQRDGNLIAKKIVFESDARVLGITPEIDSSFISFGIFESIQKGFDNSIKMIKLIFNGVIGLLSNLFSSDSSMSDLKSSLAGPISIAKYSGLAAEKGFNATIQFIVIISINLGIINLLPIPLLDGGHILFTTIEMVTRKKINQKVQNFINKVGFALLISLMVFAIYNDIVNF
jgi:regulator of sigma E protease